MNYDVTHEHCHNRQKREERKPVDLRWVIHNHTIAPERPLSSINIYMLSFKQFMVENQSSGPILGRVQYTPSSKTKSPAAESIEKIDFEREAMGMPPIKPGELSNTMVQRLNQRIDMEVGAREQETPKLAQERDIDIATANASKFLNNQISKVEKSPLNINNVLSKLFGPYYKGSLLNTLIQSPIGSANSILGNIEVDATQRLRENPTYKKSLTSQIQSKK